VHVAGAVLGANDDDDILFQASERGHVESERGVAALVTADELPVHEDRRLVINRPEVKDSSLTIRQLWQLNPAPVPDHGVGALVVDTRRPRLGRERDRDRPAKRPRSRPPPALVQTHVGVVEGEVLQTAQVFPGRAHELWSGVPGLDESIKSGEVHWHTSGLQFAVRSELHDHRAHQAHDDRPPSRTRRQDLPRPEPMVGKDDDTFVSKEYNYPPVQRRVQVPSCIDLCTDACLDIHSVPC
jgi:hypothetical protein